MKIKILSNIESKCFIINCGVHKNKKENILCDECYNDFLQKKFIDRKIIIIKKIRKCFCYKKNTPNLFIEVYASNKEYIRYIDIVESFALIEEKEYLKTEPCSHTNLLKLEKTSEVQYLSYFI